MTVKERILDLFEERNELSVVEIANELLVSKQMIHLVLKQLLESNQVEKFGRTPKTIYRKASPQTKNPTISYQISESQKQFLADNFLLISETGELMKGEAGFTQWCKKRGLPIEKTVEEFIQTKEKYNQYLDKEGLISGFNKIKSTKGFEAIYLDEILYLDFYAIERFGKTKLGTILHYAKQGQNKMLMKMLIQEIQPKINIILKKYKIDAIAYVPPTIKRETQLMKVMAHGLKINLPEIEIQKISGIIPVPQKSLNKMDERINNAESTFTIKGTVRYKNVLLIDDAVGSGATLNQIAGKMKTKKVAEKIIGLAIVGSYKGFDVVTDV